MLSVIMLQYSWAALVRGMTLWTHARSFLEQLAGLGHATFAILACTGLWIAAGLLLRRSLAAMVPWAAVLLVSVWNEAAQLVLQHWPDRVWQYRESARDLLLAMLLPTLLMLAIRARPALFQAAGAKRRR
jgi:hypothetical protein